MAEPSPPPPPKPAAAPPKPPNPVFRMMGLPNLPRKLPGRNWMIFWAVTGAFTTAVVYDRREKRRATAKWRRVVAPLATEPIANASQLPRKLTIYLEAPPGDGLRVTQEHFIEYAKPVLAASGLDWEFVQGRAEGDVRAAVAEKIRRTRRATERPEEEVASTDESNLEQSRKQRGLAPYEGVKGDIVVGRHAWKEYVRGLHEGWLGSLDAPAQPELEITPPVETPTVADGEAPTEGETKEEKPEEKKPERPPQPPPYNTPEDYSSATLPYQTPAEFSPSVPIAFPHRLGFSHTIVRLGRFLNQRSLADNIGRDIAAACLAASRDWREADGQYEQQLVLQHEEDDWPKSVWKEDAKPVDDAAPLPPREKTWTSPMVVDPRVVQRMRRFDVLPEDAARAAQLVVPESEVEGWIKGSLRSLWQWGAGSFKSEQKGPNVGNLDEE